MISSQILSAEARKQAAVDFLQMVVAGQIEEAYTKYIDPNGKHHNPFFAAGFESLKKGMMENHIEMPHKQLTVKHVIADGDIVAVHSRLQLQAGGPSLRTVHIFRFEGNKAVELWDIGQEMPTDSPNKEGAF
jgi:predicted SnoaL-like aldol condensation-catalyzing enzyme